MKRYSAPWQKTLQSGLSIALVLATAINGFLALTIVRFAWALAHNYADRFDGLDVAMYVLAISAPISALCFFGLLIAVVFQFGGRVTREARFHSGAVSLTGVNILAPVLLWYFLKWAAS